MMDVMWEKAVETALGGDTDYAATQTLTLDGAVKCVKGKLPPRSLLEKFQNLQHLSIANIGVSSLDQFPRLPKLRKLVLSDNRIAGGLHFLVDAGLHSLRDLDLSNNRIHFIEDLAPLAQLTFVSLDLYECPVTRLKDYRSRVFGLINSLKYLDKMDADGNERPESDDEEEEEEDPGSCEIDGEEWTVNNGHGEAGEGIVDVDEDEESDADEEETESARWVNRPEQNGFRVAAVEGRDVPEENDEENESREEVDEDGDDDDVVEVYEIEDSDDEEDGVDDDDSGSDGGGGGDDDDDDDSDSDDYDDDEEEEVDNEEGGFTEPGSMGRLTSTDGEIDGHERGEDDGDEDDNGETGEDEQGIEDDEGFEDQDDVEEEVRKPKSFSFEI